MTNWEWKVQLATSCRAPDFSVINARGRECKPQVQGPAGNQRHVHVLCYQRHFTGALLFADDPAGSKLLMVMEYVEGGPIVVGHSATEKSRLPEIVAKRFFRDIILVRHAPEHSLLSCWPRVYVACPSKLALRMSRSAASLGFATSHEPCRARSHFLTSWTVPALFWGSLGQQLHAFVLPILAPTNLQRHAMQ